MRVVVILALAASVALIIALTTASTWPALLVVALAAAGIVVLLRDWRAERRSARAIAAPADLLPGGSLALRPDEFAPDISTDPGGPSSDARSD